MTADPAKPFDRDLLKRRRNRIAAGASDRDFLLQRVSKDITERVQIVQREFPKALNLGAHHGVLSRSLRSLAKVGLVVDAEYSNGLLAHCDGPCVLCDEEALAFGDGDFDLIASGLSLQFVNDLPGTLVQIRRALKSDGLLLAALAGGETLKELRQAWFLAEEEVIGGVSPRVAPFIDVRALRAFISKGRFRVAGGGFGYRYGDLQDATCLDGGAPRDGGDQYARGAAACPGYTRSANEGLRNL